MTRGESTRKRTSVSYSEQGEGEEDQDEVSSTRSGRKTIKRKPQVEQDYSDEEEDKYVEETSKKKRKTGAKKSTGRKGKLSKMNDLPLDIWLTIAENLDPLSLLYMSRANKALHSVFTSRRARSLWTTVIAEAHLPELEYSNNFSDMAMVSLIYEKNCHLCGKARAQLVDYRLKMRWCAKCRNNNLFRDYLLAFTVKPDLVSTMTKLCIVPTLEGKSNRYLTKTFHLESEAKEVNTKLLELEAQVKFVKGEENKSYAQWELDDYVEERKAYVATALELGQKLTRWHNASAHERSSAAAEVRTARRAAIEKRLSDLGYSTRDRIGLYEHRAVMDRATALTESIWSRISPALIANCEATRNARLEQEALRRSTKRRALLQERYDSLLKATPDEAQKTFPSFAIFTDLPIVKTFWKEEDAVCTDESWEEASEEISRQVAGAVRWIKLGFASLYVEARQFIGHPLPEDVVASIDPAGYTPKPCNASYVFVSYPTQLVEGDTGVEIDHPATISNTDLDDLLARWSCGFIVTNATPQNYPQIYTTQRKQFVSPTRYNIATEWLKMQLAILESTGIDDGPSSQMELEQLGGVFECQGCHQSISTSWTYNAILALRVEKEKPKQTKDMIFSTMFAHANEHHRSSFFATSRYGLYHPTIRLQTGTTPSPEPPQVESAQEFDRKPVIPTSPLPNSNLSPSPEY
ncbi:hypothetical protein JCM5353_002327 [Sporobolomyces roseus]